MKELDAYTIQHEPIASIALMERACNGFVSWFSEKFFPGYKIGVICGIGNNGGDGLGIARLLYNQGYDVKVWIVKGSMRESDDFKINFDRVRDKLPIFEISTENDQELFSDRHVLIDAVLGSGISRAVEGIYSHVIKCINNAHAIRVSIDVPSGLMVDRPSIGKAVFADYTVTFQLPKLAFLFPESYRHVGEWSIVDIGLNKRGIDLSNSNCFLLEQSDIRALLKTRKKFAHKGTFGHAMLIAGSYGKMGAAVLSARSVLRSGAGLVTVHVPACGYVIMQTSVPEAMVSIDADEKILTLIPDADNYSAIGIGPGIGQDSKTVSALKKLLATVTKPLVLDADALNIIGANRELMGMLPPNSILTPHPKEFERLVGSWENDFERLAKQIDFSVKTGTIVLLKGAHSSITAPDGKVYFNNTGNPGMATGGSGDVLTGVITGLLAQGYSALDSALVGCWVHGVAGDRAAAQFGQISMIASDMVDYLPKAFGID